MPSSPGHKSPDVWKEAPVTYAGSRRRASRRCDVRIFSSSRQFFLQSSLTVARDCSPTMRADSLPSYSVNDFACTDSSGRPVACGHARADRHNQPNKRDE